MFWFFPTEWTSFEPNTFLSQQFKKYSCRILTRAMEVGSVLPLGLNKHQLHLFAWSRDRELALCCLLPLHKGYKMCWALPDEVLTYFILLQRNGELEPIKRQFRVSKESSGFSYTTLIKSVRVEKLKKNVSTACFDKAESDCRCFTLMSFIQMCGLYGGWEQRNSLSTCLFSF